MRHNISEKRILGRVAPDGEFVLVKDGNAAQGTGQPFCVVFSEFGIYRLQEGSDKRRLPGGAFNSSLIPEIFDYARSAKCSRTRKSFYSH